MGSVRCAVHMAQKDYPYLKVVRIRADAFKGFENKRFIVRISNKQNGKTEYFEAEYANDTYMQKWQDKGQNFTGNLIFMSKPCRDLLNVQVPRRGEPPDWVEVEEVEGKELLSIYSVHGALSDEYNEGRIWIKPSKQNADLRKVIEKNRRIIRIKRKDAKAVYNEALYADAFYLEKWKEKEIEFGNNYNFIFINGWYRRLLGIEESPPVIIRDLEVKRRRNPYALLYRYPRNHPQVLVFMANMVGIIGFGLGVIGAGFGIVSISDWLGVKIIGYRLCAVGFIFTLLGMIGLIGR